MSVVTHDVGVTGVEALHVSADVTETEWARFVEHHPDATAYHAWGWRRVFERAFGHETIYLAAREDGEVVGVLPLVAIKSWIFGRSLVSLPFVNYGGVLATGGRAARALVDATAALAARHGASHVELRHRARCFDDLPFKSHKAAMCLPLAGDPNVVWNRLAPTIRNRVRKAEKSGLTSETGGRDLLADFYTVFAENMRDLGTPVYGRRFFEEVLAEFGPRARVFIVRQGSTAVAVGIGLGSRGTFEVPWASSLKSVRVLSPNTLLYWHAIRHAVAEGYGTFDFGRSTPGDGPYEFKLRWGAQPSPLFWEYRLFNGRALPDTSPANPTFRPAIAVWKRLPVRLATWLGPSIVASIP